MADPIRGYSSSLHYYQDLFATSNPTYQSLTLDHIPRVITKEMEKMLKGEFLEHEVTTALKQMALLKAPSPDGMPPQFYQHFCQMVDHHVIKSILFWLNSSTLPYPVNHTFVALIPKIKNLEHVTEYCPFSFCNVLYKIFSKVPANRLKKVLPKIIIEHQSTFAKDFLISDNILIVFETLYCLKNYDSSVYGFMALKLNMSKVYDRVEW